MKDPGEWIPTVEMLVQRGPEDLARVVIGQCEVVRGLRRQILDLITEIDQLKREVRSARKQRQAPESPDSN